MKKRKEFRHNRVNSMNRILIQVFLSTFFFAGCSFAQAGTESEKMEVENLRFGFCPQPCIADLNHDVKLLKKVMSALRSTTATIEFDFRESKIIYYDTKGNIERFKAVLKLIDGSFKRSSNEIRCAGEREATLFFQPID